MTKFEHGCGLYLLSPYALFPAIFPSIFLDLHNFVIFLETLETLYHPFLLTLNSVGFRFVNDFTKSLITALNANGFNCVHSLPYYRTL